MGWRGQGGLRWSRWPGTWGRDSPPSAATRRGRAVNLLMAQRYAADSCGVNYRPRMMAAMTTPATATGAALAPGDPRISTWRDFLLAHARLQRILDQELRSDHDISL